MDKDDPWRKRGKKARVKYFTALASLYGTEPRNEKPHQFSFEIEGAPGRLRANRGGNLVRKK